MLWSPSTEPSFCLGHQPQGSGSVVVIVGADLLWRGPSHRMLRNEEGRLDYEDVEMECHQQEKAPEECPVGFLVHCAEGRRLESSAGNLLTPVTG